MRDPAAPSRRWRVPGSGVILSIATTGLVFQLLSVASGPFVARVLGPEGRGHLAVVMVMMLLCTQVGLGALPAAVSRAVAAADAPARDVLRGHLRWWLAAAVVPAGVAVGLTAVILRGTDNLAGILSVTFVLTVLSVWGILRNSMLEGERNALYLNGSRLLGMLFYVLLVVTILLVRPESSIVVILGAYGATLVVSQLIAGHGLRRATGDPAHQADRGEIHRFARRGFVSGIRLLDGLGTDQIIVGILVGQTALGLYAVAVSVSIVPVIVLTGLGTMLLPRMVANPEQSGHTMRRWIAAAAAIDVLCVAATQLGVGPLIRFAFGDEFAPAISVARILVVACGFLALRRVLIAAAQAQGRERRASVIEAVSWVILVVASIPLGQKYDEEGVAAAFIIAAALSCVFLATVVRWTGESVESVDDREITLGEIVANDEIEQLRP